MLPCASSTLLHKTHWGFYLMFSLLYLRLADVHRALSPPTVKEYKRHNKGKARDSLKMVLHPTFGLRPNNGITTGLILATMFLHLEKNLLDWGVKTFYKTSKPRTGTRKSRIFPIPRTKVILFCWGILILCKLWRVSICVFGKWLTCQPPKLQLFLFQILTAGSSADAEYKTFRPQCQSISIY